MTQTSNLCDNSPIIVCQSDSLILHVAGPLGAAQLVTHAPDQVHRKFPVLYTAFCLDLQARWHAVDDTLAACRACKVLYLCSRYVCAI